MKTLPRIFFTSSSFVRNNARKILRVVWACCCALATLATIVWQCSNYYYGEEQTFVDYKNFNERETNLYPSIGVCWTRAIIEEKLKLYGNNFTAKDYGDFLLGHTWNEDMLKVDYEDVTSRFDDSISIYGYRTGDMKLVFLHPDGHNTVAKPGFKEYFYFGDRCFTIDIPFQKDVEIFRFFLIIDPRIFGKGIISTSVFHEQFSGNNLVVTPFYRNQLLAKVKSGIRSWPFKELSGINGTVIQLNVGHIDIVVRRNNMQQQCIEGAPDYDRQIIGYVMNTVGCKPPFWNSTSTLKPCSEQKQLQEIKQMLKEAFDRGNRRPTYMSVHPCNSLERISYDVEHYQNGDIPEWWRNRFGIHDKLGIFFDFTEFTYKEIKTVRGMDIQALIGR